MNTFSATWFLFMKIGIFCFVVISLLDYVTYQLRVIRIYTLKNKYEFILKHEINVLKRVFIWLSIAVFFAINMYAKEVINTYNGAFFVRAFFGLSGATIVAFIAILIIEYSYPARFNKKLMVSLSG